MQQKGAMWISALLLVVTAGAPAQGWELVQETDGIVVARREVPGSAVVAFRGEGDLDAPLAVAATVIFDTSRAHEWAEDLEESRIVRWTSGDEYVEYDHVGTPFILKDRDFVSAVTLSVDPANQAVTFRYRPALDDGVPEKGCCVRGELLNTTFVLTARGPSRTHVVAEVQIDPKGWLPTFVANWVQADWPVATFRALRKQVAKSDIVVAPRFLPLSGM